MVNGSVVLEVFARAMQQRFRENAQDEMLRSDHSQENIVARPDQSEMQGSKRCSVRDRSNNLSNLPKEIYQSFPWIRRHALQKLSPRQRQKYALSRHNRISQLKAWHRHKKTTPPP